MELAPAPFFTDVYPGPEGGQAHWAQTSDGKRIRVGHWPLSGAKGTVLLFPGRTEYIEKYGVIAQDLADRGLATIAIDWRGQGLAERLCDDPRIGHVDAFSDYQKDVSAMLRAARELALPRPYFLLAHSMGGCIGLRAVMEGLPVKAAAFTGPMWGVFIAPHLRAVAGMMARVMPAIGKGLSLPPGTKIDPYVTVQPFEDNMLTTDSEMYDMMRDQLAAHPELALGAPSFIWLREALTETQHLAGRSAPNLPAVSWLGSNERIVETSRIHQRMETWKGGRLEIVEGGEHEVLMESRALRAPIMDDMAKLFLDTVTS
ncbi:alpha/beta hydrolase [Sulfitobacter mediterraneus]|uniref:alpha/beta fold hydrolase n=1 Tax=Sulfitobacter mediterraneus TaxID=83219 RepID=UPI0019337901|nr:alpha/beta hydrolase [Sulfitobacter mediterraneus]MBM1311570.1 alpha/beta hydrolase [Sulfitobacter mediterraneus]MBM1315452.1 alpha/beta hydrolase [Sulfitobacter mediterraneus]MBM1323813.1 alpha/beta hydrolase [Sulfitobacter mediterraneus]MBM1327725.1 alpha/beta hydrolase [Sulfitobacter mediterraneus]MBM1399073.1 alpha/beta hydrolase [Sulfitobacter mediterraneus]